MPIAVRTAPRPLVAGIRVAYEAHHRTVLAHPRLHPLASLTDHSWSLRSEHPAERMNVHLARLT